MMTSIVKFVKKNFAGNEKAPTLMYGPYDFTITLTFLITTSAKPDPGFKNRSTKYRILMICSQKVSHNVQVNQV